MTPRSGGNSEREVGVELICVTPEHITMGEKVPNGQGTLSVTARRWAYCTAGLHNAEHEWKETGGVALDAIRHDDVQRYLSGP